MDRKIRKLKGEQGPRVRFDLAAARQMTDSYAGSCGVHCCLYDDGGRLLHQRGEPNADCAFCRKLTELTGRAFDCEKLHSYAALQAERFGGRYIYVCPVGMTFFTAPILMGGRYAGALAGGPMLIMEEEDLWEGELFSPDLLTAERSAEVRELLARVPRAEPRRVEELSRQLFASAVYIGDSSHELFLAQREQSRQNTIGDYIARLKTGGNPPAYPVDKENELVLAITRGDKETAGDRLNEILGYIFFYTSGMEEIHARVTELLVVLSRAAVQGGANVERIFEINGQYLQDLRRMGSQEELTRWLANSLNRFTNLVFDLMDVKHRNAMHAAVGYLRENYMGRVTLEEAAERAGYSPAYLSRIFREEMGQTFKEYLNELRVDRSKTLLLATQYTNAEICTMVGFNDQSYYCRVFRRVTGVSPDAFRKRVRRIDADREHGRK